MIRDIDIFPSIKTKSAVVEFLLPEVFSNSSDVKEVHLLVADESREVASPAASWQEVVDLAETTRGELDSYVHVIRGLEVGKEYVARARLVLKSKAISLPLSHAVRFDLIEAGK